MIVDASVLLYAVDEASPFHRLAKNWLEAAFNGPGRVGLPWATLLAFQRISTHPRSSDNPLSPAEAWSYIEDWLKQEASWLPQPGKRHAEIMGRLIVGSDLRGNLVSDAHLAALAIEHGVGICSADSDFARFPGVEWYNPMTAY